MAKHVLSEISSNIQQFKFYSLMADETTDAGNKEQLVIVYHWIDNEFAVHEDFVGLHELKKADSQTIFQELTTSMNEIFTDCVANVMMRQARCLEIKVALLSFSQILNKVQLIHTVMVMH